MTRSKQTLGKVLVKVVFSMVVAFSGLTLTTGCDETDSSFDSLFGQGFRFGNFNQGIPSHMDCRANPLDPRC